MKQTMPRRNALWCVLALAANTIACSSTAPSDTEFDWELSPLSRPVRRGETATFTLTIHRKHNINSAVRLSARNVFEPRLSVAVNPQVMGSTVSTATISVPTDANTSIGFHTIEVTATEDGYSADSQSVFVEVTADGGSSPTAPGR